MEYDTMTGPQLVAAFNGMIQASGVSGEWKPVKRFTSPVVGRKRCAALAHLIADLAADKAKVQAIAQAAVDQAQPELVAISTAIKTKKAEQRQLIERRKRLINDLMVEIETSGDSIIQLYVGLAARTLTATDELLSRACSERLASITTPRCPPVRPGGDDGPHEA